MKFHIVICNWWNQWQPWLLLDSSKRTEAVSLQSKITPNVPNTKSPSNCAQIFSIHVTSNTDFLWRTVGLIFKPPNSKTALCQLSTTAYLIYSQLPSISGGHFLKLQPKYVPCCVKGPTSHGIFRLEVRWFELHVL
jgi:hypothetical protein